VNRAVVLYVRVQHGTLIVPRWISYVACVVRQGFREKEFVLDVIEFDKGQRIFESKCDSVFIADVFTAQFWLCVCN